MGNKRFFLCSTAKFTYIEGTNNLKCYYILTSIHSNIFLTVPTTVYIIPLSTAENKRNLIKIIFV